jgi:hypothetical protein
MRQELFSVGDFARLIPSLDHQKYMLSAVWLGTLKVPNAIHFGFSAPLSFVSNAWRPAAMQVIGHGNPEFVPGP